MKRRDNQEIKIYCEIARRRVVTVLQCIDVQRKPKN